MIKKRKFTYLYHVHYNNDDFVIRLGFPLDSNSNLEILRGTVKKLKKVAEVTIKNFQLIKTEYYNES